jgi:hypothetical protein
MEQILPATTQPWLWSHHSDLNYANNDKVTPSHNDDMPKEITAVTLNTTGKKFSLPDDDASALVISISSASRIKSNHNSLVLLTNWRKN